MVTDYEPAIDFSTFPDSDGEPMAENDVNRIQMNDLIFALQRLMSGRDDVYVGGNLLVYYNAANGWDHLSPDVFVAFGVQSGPRHSWRTWIEGKFPDVVFEITSPSTEDMDRGRKMKQYAALGAGEYYIYDPEAHMQSAFNGHRLAAGRYVPLLLEPSGGIVSPLLGVELRPVDGWLRVIDPGNGGMVPIPGELDALLQTAVTSRRVAEQRATQEAQARQEAEKRATQEMRARQEAEQRAAAAEAELQALRAALAKGASSP
jgi:Uma2 family endonuclease